jgi:hypothetical protein
MNFQMTSSWEPPVLLPTTDAESIIGRFRSYHGVILVLRPSPRTVRHLEAGEMQRTDLMQRQVMEAAAYLYIPRRRGYVSRDESHKLGIQEPSDAVWNDLRVHVPNVHV